MHDVLFKAKMQIIRHLQFLRFHRACLIFWFIIAAMLFPSSGTTQILEFDQNPPNLKWRQIQTENFQVIFPSEFEQKARQLSRQLDRLMARVNADLNAPRRMTPLILQNQSVVSNGFVQLAPRRTEFITTPPAQGENMDWLTHLTIHELRHIGQFDQLVGRFKAPFWEQLGLALFGLHLPIWFYEGDAVYKESELTSGGRGRMPSWLMSYRWSVLNDRNYSYQKEFLGSYRDLTPGPYELGYLMVQKMYSDLGPEVVNRLLSDVSKRLLRPYSFSRALKKESGMNTRAWHAATLEDLREKWSSWPLEPIGLSDYADFSELPLAESKFPSDWLFPQWGEDGSLYVLRQGRAFVPEIIRYAAGKESTILQLGWQKESHYSYAAGRIVWDELRSHPRYSKQNFSVIHVHDVERGRSRQLTRGTRLFTPALSPDGGRIAAIQVEVNQQASIVILDAENGQERGAYPAPDGWMLQTPSFHPKSDKLLAVGISAQGSALVELSGGVYRRLTPWMDQQLERPIYYAEDVIFKAHLQGRDNIYLLRNGEVQALTQAQYGAFHPAIKPESHQLLFNFFEDRGLKVGQMDLEGVTGRRVLSISGSSDESFEVDGVLALEAVQVGSEDPQYVQDELLESQPYGGLSTLFNFHSLSLTSGDFSSFEAINPGIFLLSDNLLNTVQTRLGYSYDGDLRAGEYRASVSYQRFFPKFNLGYKNRVRTGSTDQVGLRWRENVVDLSVNIPMNWHRYNHRYYVQWAGGTSIVDRYGLELSQPHAEAEKRFVDQIRFPFQTAISFGHNVRSSALDVAPRWGQHLSISYRYFQNNRLNQGEKSSHWMWRSTFYFPGIAAHHSTSIRLNYQRGAGTYAQLNEIPLVSGYDQLDPRPVRNTVLLAYRFPLAYPDWEIGSVMYVKRLRSGLFTDFENVNRRRPFDRGPRSLGVELQADFHLFRFYLPQFTAGTKLIYAPENRSFLMTYGISYSY